MAARTKKPAPQLLAHPLIGKQVTCEVTPDAHVGRKAGTAKGVLTSYDGTAICIGKQWFWTSSTVNLKAA